MEVEKKDEAVAAMPQQEVKTIDGFLYSIRATSRALHHDEDGRR